MKYTRFEITNFKGIRHLTLDLTAHPEGRIVALVGLNESGKTTILEALDYLQLGDTDSDPRGLTGLNRDDPHDLIPIAERSNFNGSIEISVSVQPNEDDNGKLRSFLSKHGFYVSLFDPLFTVSDIYEFEDSTYTGRRGLWRFDPTGTYNRGRTMHRLSEYKDIWEETIQFIRTQMPGIWYFPNFLFDFPRRIYLDTKDSEDSKERFYRNLLTEILWSVDPTATVQRHIVNA